MEFQSTGRLSQTKYNLHELPEKILITRKHHPLVGQRFEILVDGKKFLVIRLHDGSAAKIPKQWTELAATENQSLANGDNQFSVESLREFLKLVEAISRRT